MQNNVIISILPHLSFKIFSMLAVAAKAAVFKGY